MWGPKELRSEKKRHHFKGKGERDENNRGSVVKLIDWGVA
jgi:hypothetical protein